MKAVVLILPETMTQILFLIAALLMIGSSIYSIWIERNKKKVVEDFKKATANFRNMFRDELEEEKKAEQA